MPLFEARQPVPRPNVVNIGFAPALGQINQVLRNHNIPIQDNPFELQEENFFEVREARAQRMEEAMLAEARRARVPRPFDELNQEEQDELLEEIERQELRALEDIRINRRNQIDMSQVEEVMKVRHLNKGERDMYHQPKPDWHDTPKGDMCKNACVLEVEDIIRKHIK